jgi:hypothetical protein
VKFTNVRLGNWNTPAGWQDVQVADVNGDGKDDVIGMDSSGTWWAGIATGSGTNVKFTTVRLGVWSAQAGWQDVLVADVNGDGKDDVIGMDRWGNWWAGITSGSGTNVKFTNVRVGAWGTIAGCRDVQVADLNGDGKADVIGMDSSGTWWAGITTGSGTNVKFTNVRLGSWNTPAGWQDVQVADVNGDGKDDVIGMDSSGTWYAGIAVGSGTNVKFTTVRLGVWSTQAGWQNVQVADVNGDGQDDVIGMTAAGQWVAGIASGSGTNVRFVGVPLGAWSGQVVWRDVQVADVNGDGKTDVIGRTSTGEWWAGIASVSAAGNVSLVNHKLGVWPEVSGAPG